MHTAKHFAVAEMTEHPSDCDTWSTSKTGRGVETNRRRCKAIGWARSM